MCAFLTSFNIKIFRKLVMHGMQLGIKKQRSEFETDWPGGSEFRAEVKKIPSPAYTPKHMEIGPGSPRPALTRVTVWVTAPLCKGEAGVRGFSRTA